MAHSYMTEAQGYDYVPELNTLFQHSNRPIYDWEVHSGSVYKSFGTGSVVVLFQDGEDLGAAESALVDVNAAGEWFYDSAIDTTYLFSAVDPNTEEITSGEDYSTYVTRRIQAASRLVDSLIDAKHSTPLPKDRSGNYDEVIIQATAYALAHIEAVGEAERDMYRDRLINVDKSGIIDGINGGWIKLEHEIDADSSQGELKIISVSGGFHPRFSGSYSGTREDRLKILISTGGAAATAKFTVQGFNAGTDTPKDEHWLDSAGEVIDLYQRVLIGNGLYVTWEGDNGDSGTTNDEWELWVRGSDLPVDNPGFRTMQSARY